MALMSNNASLTEFAEMGKMAQKKNHDLERWPLVYHCVSPCKETALLLFWCVFFSLHVLSADDYKAGRVASTQVLK